jgi:hypothetical protein
MSASQTRQALWMVAGYFLLVPFCLLRAWEPCVSTINLFAPNPETESKDRRAR